MIDTFINKLWHGDARSLLRASPSASLDTVITDAMYGTAKHVQYEWGEDPAKGDPVRHWLIAVGNIWMVQTREQPVEFPHRDSLVMCDRAAYLPLRKYHPCPKPVEEMKFLVEALTQPGQIILDCCCGLGSTLVAAETLGRNWIGCDLSKTYCQIAMKRLAAVAKTRLA